MKSADRAFGAGILAAICAINISARADDVTMRPYVSLSPTFTFADSHRRSDDGLGGMLGAGIPLNRFFNVEVGGAYSRFASDSNKANNSAWRETLAQVEGQFYYSRNPAFAPYFALDLGNAHEKRLVSHNTESALFAGAGFGAMHYFKAFNHDFAVRGDVRYHWVDTKNEHFAAGSGVSRFNEPMLGI